MGKPNSTLVVQTPRKSNPSSKIVVANSLKNIQSQLAVIVALQRAAGMDASIVRQGDVTYATVTPFVSRKDRVSSAGFQRAMVWLGQDFDLNQIADQTATFTFLRRHVTDWPLGWLQRWSSLHRLYPHNAWYKKFLGLLRDWVLPPTSSAPSYYDGVVWAHADAILPMNAFAGAAITDLGQEALKDKGMVIPTRLHGKMSNLGNLMRAFATKCPFMPFAFSTRHPLMDLTQMSVRVPSKEPYDYVIAGDTIQAFWAITPRLDKLPDLLALPIDLLVRVERKDGRYWFSILARQILEHTEEAKKEFRRTTALLSSYGYGAASRLNGIDMWDAFTAFTPGASFPKQFQMLAGYDASTNELAREVLRVLGSGLSHSRYQGDLFVGKDIHGRPLMLNPVLFPAVLTTAVPRAGKSMAEVIAILQTPFNPVVISCQSGRNAGLWPGIVEGLDGEVIYVDVPDASDEKAEMLLFKQQYDLGFGKAQLTVREWVMQQEMRPVCLQSRVSAQDNPLGTDSYAFFAFALGFCQGIVATRAMWYPLGDQRYEQRIALLFEDATSLPLVDATMRLGEAPAAVGRTFKMWLKNLTATARGLGIWLRVNLHTTTDSKVNFIEGFADTFGALVSIDSNADRSAKVTAPAPGAPEADVIYPIVDMRMPSLMEEHLLKLIKL